MGRRVYALWLYQFHRGFIEMKNLWFSFVLFGLIVIMGGYLFLDYFLFRHQGARFTAADGQAFCERVQQMDGKPCEYVRR